MASWIGADVMDDTARLDVAAQAIWRIDSFGYEDPGPPHRRMAQAAIDALQLTPEKERRRNCVCRHPQIDHDMYRDGKCGANMVSRHTPCPCTEWKPQDRVRLVSPWVRSDA